MPKTKYTVYATGSGYAVAPSQGAEVPSFLLGGVVRLYRTTNLRVSCDAQKTHAQRLADKLNGKEAKHA